MMDSKYLSKIQDVSKQHKSLDEILSDFYYAKLDDYLEDLYNTFNEEWYTLIYSDNFIESYHNFFFALTEAIDDPESLNLLAVCIRRHIDVIKELLKPYNRKEEYKDDKYSKLCRFKRDLETNYTDALNKSANLYEDGNSKLLKFVIYDLKDLDVLYHIIQHHKEIINVYIQDEHILSYIVRTFMQSIDSLSNDEKDYFKRVIEMILIRKELRIEEKELADVMKELDIRISKEDDNLKDYKYLKYRINSHFEIISKDNTILNEFVPKTIYAFHPPLDHHIEDLRGLKTYTIDYVKFAKNYNGLYDDAISMVANPNGTYFLYLHTPDVDVYLPRDKGLDNSMKRKCESVYVKGRIDPMMPYLISSRMSLVKGQDRFALTTRIHVDEDGEILGVKYMRSIINVDDNLSVNKTEVLLRDRNFEYNWLLEMMYDICKKLRENRGEEGKRGKANTIMDEFNIWTNIVTAEQFKENGLPFAFKNYVADDHQSKHIGAIRDFKNNNTLDEDIIEILYSIGDTKGRTTYSTKCLGNDKFNGLPYANVGNPLREYISLETDRLIRDLIIDEKNNLDYWKERIENDCVQQSEGVQRVKELYKTIS